MFKFIDTICLWVWLAFSYAVKGICFCLKLLGSAVKSGWLAMSGSVGFLDKFNRYFFAPVGRVIRLLIYPFYKFSGVFESILAKSKTAKRVFALVVLAAACYMIYPPAHWGPWYYYQRGQASWYGPGFYWKTKADGNKYYPWAMSAASKTLPLGSMVKVINLDNKRVAYVKIDDRGPYAKGRILDLSYRAAVKLGMKEKGVASVAIYTKKDYRKKN